MLCALHLRIQVLPLLFVFEVRDELLDSFHHLGLGEVILGEDAFQLLKEAIHLAHLMAGSLFDNTESLKALHIYLLARDIELFVGFFTSGVAFEVNYRIIQLRMVTGGDRGQVPVT